MSTLNVNTINAATSGQGVAVDVKNPRSFRNLVINGAMQVAQRGTSATTNGYGTVDRFSMSYGGQNEAPTQAQITLTSSDTGPWAKGFTKAFQITNGSQTDGADADDYCSSIYKFGGEDLANSGWEFTNPDSKITVSFWAKASVAQTYYGRLRLYASSQYEYTYSIALSADTWTKVTHTIPGNSNFSGLTNTDAIGMFHQIALFHGTNYTNNKTLNQWAVKDTANGFPDMTSTWWTTNNATFAFTGVQLEVGEYATEFEHRAYGDELERCKRYYQNSYAAGNVPGSSNNSANAINLLSWADGNVQGFTFSPAMRAAPDVILRSQNATTVARLDSSGTDRVAAAQHINQSHVKYISVTSGSGNSWASVCYELNAEL